MLTSLHRKKLQRAHWILYINISLNLGGSLNDFSCLEPHTKTYFVIFKNFFMKKIFFFSFFVMVKMVNSSLAGLDIQTI